MRSFAYALQHLSRLRIYNGPFDEAAFGGSSKYFPLAGLLLGIVLVGLNWMFQWVFPQPVKAALLLVSLVVLTGGLHLDGYMDTMDGVLSGRSRERMLEIMRDSRVGAFGALGMGCLLLLKYALLLGLPEHFLPAVLLLMAVMGRWGMVYAIARFPYARPQGLGTLFSTYTGARELATATLITFLVAIVAGKFTGLGILVIVLAITHWLCVTFVRLLGGLTGDTYGAINEIVEVVVLLAYYPLVRVLGTLDNLFYGLW